MIIRNGTVWTGEENSPPQKRTIIIHDDVISEVSDGEEARIFDATGKTIIPGLFDAHVHISLDGRANAIDRYRNEPVALTAVKAAASAIQTVRAGVTTIRDLGCKQRIDLHLRNIIAEGLLPGARVLASGTAICSKHNATGAYFGAAIDGAREAREAAKKLADQGVDQVKLIAGGGGADPNQVVLSVEELSAAVEVAHAAGKLTTAHAHGREPIRNALDAGVDCIEHGTYLDDEIAELMRMKQVYLVPTFSASQQVPSTPPLPLLPQPDPGEIPSGNSSGGLALSQKSARRLEIALRNGVELVTGTDCGNAGKPHSQLIKEILLLAAGGMSTEQALSCATRVAARALGIDSLTGTIEQNKKADLVILDRDPFSSIENLYTVDIVIKDGRIVYAR